EIDAGLTYLHADDVGPPRGADDRVGEVGISDEHVFDVARQIDHDRFADTERNKLGACFAAHDLDHCRALLAGNGRCGNGCGTRRRRRRAHASVGGRCAAGRGEPEGGNQSDQQGGADQRHVPHDRSPHCHFHFIVAGMLTPNRTTLTPRRPSSAAAAASLRSKSTRARSASDSVPCWRARASVSACRGPSSSVAVFPTTTRWPFFSSTVWSIASTGTLGRMI